MLSQLLGSGFITLGVIIVLHAKDFSFQSKWEHLFILTSCVVTIVLFDGIWGLILEHNGTKKFKRRRK